MVTSTISNQRWKCQGPKLEVNSGSQSVRMLLFFGGRQQSLIALVKTIFLRACGRSSANSYKNHVLNVKDREPEGIIDPKEYYKVRNSIINELYKLKDPETGADVYSPRSRMRTRLADESGSLPPTRHRP